MAERSPRWRTLGALRRLAVWWLLIPLVVWIPPHIPWVLIVAAVGAIRAYSRFSEERTLVALHGVCPKCGTEQDFPAGGTLRQRHTVTCKHCKWELKLALQPPPRGTAEPGPGAAAGK